MDIRKTVEKWEEKNLSQYAAKSSQSRGRARKEEPCPVRTEFQKDRDKILHSLSFRLLKHKTQVYLSTTGEDFRTRLTHTLEVAAVGRYIAKALNLNQDLVEAMALGHDLGHTPFGHIGEKALNELTPFRFNHARQSVRVARKIEDHGRGLNLTREVIDGIKNHSKGDKSVYSVHGRNLKNSNKTHTIEGEILQFSDWIAYINHDVDDAFNMGLITKEDLPPGTAEILGFNFQQRVITMISSVIEYSAGKEHIHMDSRVMKATDRLREFLYKNIYRLQDMLVKEESARLVVAKLYDFYLNNYDLVLEEMPYLEGTSPERGACDYIAFLTDLKAQELYRKHRLDR